MSARPDDLERLTHIVDAINRIKRFTEKMPVEEFLKDEVTQFAVVKNFEIIGEAAYHVSDETKKIYHEIEWEKVMAFRHFLVHEYYRVSMKIVWNTRSSKIDMLRDQISNILNK